MPNIPHFGLRAATLVAATVLAVGAVYATGILGGGRAASPAASAAAGPDYDAVFSGSTRSGVDAPAPTPVPANSAQVSRPNRRSVAEAAAPIIGISVRELAQAVNAGQTIVAVAAAHNINPQALRDSLNASEKAALAKAITAGQITQQQADQAARLFALQVGRYLGDAPPAKPKS